MELVNLTPHPIVLALPSGGERTIPPSGLLARIVRTIAPPIINVDGLEVPVVLDTPGELMVGDAKGLPAPRPGTVFLVSAVVLAQIHRADVLAPATGPEDGALRNDQGQIVAVTRLRAAPGITASDLWGTLIPQPRYPGQSR